MPELHIDHSNEYSKPEGILLKWVEQHIENYFKQRSNNHNETQSSEKSNRVISNFSTCFYDGIPIISIVVNTVGNIAFHNFSYPLHKINAKNDAISLY